MKHEEFINEKGHSIVRTTFEDAHKFKGSSAPPCSVCQTALEDDGEHIRCPQCFEIMDESTQNTRPSDQA